MTGRVSYFINVFAGTIVTVIYYAEKTALDHSLDYVYKSIKVSWECSYKTSDFAGNVTRVYSPVATNIEYAAHKTAVYCLAFVKKCSNRCLVFNICVKV